MLSEPFHRLIVKDEEELDDGKMNTVPEEDEDLSSWW
jgi:hypothetical protein